MGSGHDSFTEREGAISRYGMGLELDPLLFSWRAPSSSLGLLPHVGFRGVLVLGVDWLSRSRSNCSGPLLGEMTS